MDKIYRFTQKDLIAIKVWHEHEQLPVEEYCKIVLKKIELLLELMNSLYENNIKVDEWKIWSEAVIFKICFHSTSLLKLFEGTKLPYKDVVIFDEPSINILFRAVLENHLMFHFLFVENISLTEREFRF